MHGFAKEVVLHVQWITHAEKEKEGTSREENSVGKGVEIVKFKLYLANTE